MARTKKITIEVEVPEGLEEGAVARFLEETARKMEILARVVKVEPKPSLTREDLALLQEIKRGIVRRAEKRAKDGTKGMYKEPYGEH